MKPHDKLTILRNRHRARDMRLFREAVEAYFDRTEYVADDLPVDWEGARAARAQINRMLPRAIQIVHAAGLEASTDTATDPGPRVADVDALRNIFGARYANGGEQDILDVIDMALGVYEAGRFGAFARTFNPLYYVVTVLTFVAKIPRRALNAIGILPQRSRAPRMRPEDITRLEAVASRLADTEELIETRLAEIRERQAQQLAENASQITELAERLDFTERVLAQQRAVDRLRSPNEQDVPTPV